MLVPCVRRAFLQALALSTAGLAPASSKRASGQEQPSRDAPSVIADGGARQIELKHRTVTLSGLRFHIAEAGQGPLVLLCHGWPESWYSWRHQLRALADAGFRAVAADMRGFGQTEAPEDVAAYTIVHHVGDMVQLVSALRETQAVIVGHDWGSPVAWTSALLRPDIFRAVIMMSVPYLERSRSAPLKALREAGISTFYWQYFQTPGVAEAELERDVERTIRTMLYGQGLSPKVTMGEGFLSGTSVPGQLPSWLTGEDVVHYVNTYKATGFRGGLNWYRNVDRNWELEAAWERLRIRQPALFIAGTEDIVIKWFAGKAVKDLQTTVPGLRETRLIPGAGHSVQQECAGEVNSTMLDFLRST